MNTVSDAVALGSVAAGASHADRALATDSVPVLAEGATATAGLPSIETILFDPAEQARVLRQLQKKGRPQSPLWIRLGAAASGAVLLFAGVYVGWDYYLNSRHALPLASGPRPPSSPAPLPVAPPAAQPPVVRSAAAPPADSNVPRPVTTAPVTVVPAPGAAQPTAPATGRLDLSEEWLRAHEALGLPPPRGVKTVKIIPPKSE